MMALLYMQQRGKNSIRTKEDWGNIAGQIQGTSTAYIFCTNVIVEFKFRYKMRKTRNYVDF